MTVVLRSVVAAAPVRAPRHSAMTRSRTLVALIAVALEAAACGRPVVAAGVGGLRTIVDDGHTGLLVDGRDPVAYAHAVESVLRNPELARSMGEAAAHRAAGFTWSITAARLRRLYTDLVARELVACA